MSTGPICSTSLFDRDLKDLPKNSCPLFRPVVMENYEWKSRHVGKFKGIVKSNDGTTRHCYFGGLGCSEAFE